MPELPNREREIFNTALDQATPAGRSAYLDEVCGDDAALRARVDALLRAHDAAGGFLAEKIAPVAGGVELISEGPGTRLGRYKLLERIGEGGFGVVYLAEQDEPVHRRVALKIIKLGMDTRAVIARFEAERQALAMMDHPNIATVFDGGATETGRPYFVMELVRGIPITAFCDEQRLSVRARLELFMQVCHAVQHAHQKGVIHRDLKPSNIMVTLHDDRPVPKVIDFGIAKATQQRLTEKSMFTRFHQFIGTPAYMSPEQTGISGLDIDTRSDIYSLGVLLYELLAGRTPFDTEALLEAGYAEIQRTIRETEPPAPSHRVAALNHAEQTTAAERRRLETTKLTRHLRGDLDRVVMKCLQKDRTRRYETANGLALDLRRHLQNEPVLARPDTPAYRTAKFVRRHRKSVAFVALVCVVLVAGLVGTITQARRATRQAARADAQRDFALRQLSRAEAINDLNSFLLSDAAPMGGTFTVGDLLARAEEVVDRDLADTEENRVEMLVAIGRYYWSLDMDEKARAVLEKAYARAGALADHSSRPYAAAALASMLARAGEFERAEQLVRSALAELGDAPENEWTRVFCLLRASEVARERGDSATGVARAEEAQALVDKFPAGSGVGKLTVALDVAESYRMADRGRDAATAFERAWKQLVALGRERTEKAGTLLNNWALALDDLGHPREAATLFQQAVAISTDSSGKGVSPMLLNNYARALQDLGQSNTALDLAERALGQARLLGDEIVINQTLLNLVRIHLGRGAADQAAEALAEVEPRYRRMFPPGYYAFAAVEGYRAALALARNDPDVALVAANRAVTISESATQGREYLPTFLLRRAEVQLRLQHPAEARADAARALALAQAAAVPGEFSSRIGRAWLILAQALETQGEIAAARTAFASALEHLRPCLGEDHAQTRQATRGVSPPP